MNTDNHKNIKLGHHGFGNDLLVTIPDEIKSLFLTYFADAEGCEGQSQKFKLEANYLSRLNQFLYQVDDVLNYLEEQKTKLLLDSELKDISNAVESIIRK